VSYLPPSTNDVINSVDEDEVDVLLMLQTWKMVQINRGRTRAATTIRLFASLIGNSQCNVAETYAFQSTDSNCKTFVKTSHRIVSDGGLSCQYWYWITCSFSVTPELIVVVTLFLYTWVLYILLNYFGKNLFLSRWRTRSSHCCLTDWRQNCK